MCCDFYGSTSEKTAELENAVVERGHIPQRNLFPLFYPPLQTSLRGRVFSNDSPSIITQ